MGGHGGGGHRAGRLGGRRGRPDRHGARPQPERDRQPAGIRRKRRRWQGRLRHPCHHQLGARFLRASADARGRVRPARPHDVDEPAQLHFGQCRGVDRQYHLDPLRRLSQLDPAAGDAERVQGRGVGQLRPPDHRQRPHLLDRRRAAGRPPRHGGDAHRGPALYDDRAQSGRAPGLGRAFRPLGRVRSA